MRAGAIVVGAAGVLLALTGVPASAHVDDITCSAQLPDPDNRVGVRCGHPGPDNHRFRAWASCTDGRTHVGAWYYVNSGSWSWANCGTNKFLTNWGVDITSS